MTFLREGEEEAGSWTYGGLDACARAVAAELVARGATGQTVLLFYPSGLEFIAGFLGCLYAGAIAVPAALPRAKRNLDRFVAIAENANPALVLSTVETSKRLAPFVLGSAFEHLPWLATDELPSTLAHQWCPPPIAEDTIAFLQFTSGSTADPKGVIVTHRTLLANHRMMQAAFAQREESVWVVWLPLFHDMGLIGNLLQALYTGGHCVMMSPEAFLVKPIRWLRAISHYRAHTSGGPNFAYDLCVRKITPAQRAELDLSAWTCAFNGAEPVRAGTLEAFQETFAESGFHVAAHLPCYGLAEATLFVSGVAAAIVPAVLEVCATSLEQGLIRPPSDGITRKLVSCGPAWEGGHIRIVHPETLCPCACDTVGEIWVEGPHVASGYWRLPEETACTFGGTIAAIGEGPFLRTGDLGFLQGGELFVTGRLKDMIIIAGRNHYSTDIEKTVEQSSPAVRPAGGAAFSLAEEGGECLVILAEIERSARAMVAEVEATIRAAVAEEHGLMPRAIVLLPPGGIPKTSSGKIQRPACRRAWFDGTLPKLSS